MSRKIYDVIVVGGGFAGLSASYYLKKRGLNHLVFERGKIGESWRSLRWDSFMLNSTNILNLLPGQDCGDRDPDGFDSAKALAHAMEKYAEQYQLPVSENTKVITVEKQDELFHVTVVSNGVEEKYLSRQVLIASGVSNEIKIPSIAEKISSDIQQLHACQYRNARQLAEGAVLVVGSAQSGIQIANDLLNAGRKVFIATSKVARIPRWYRGRDIFYWLEDLGFFDVKPGEITDPEVFKMKPPHVPGGNNGNDTISLQFLAKKGLVILGRLDNADGDNLVFQPNAAQHIQFADDSSKRLKEMIDEFITNKNLSAPAAHRDEADMPDTEFSCVPGITSLNLKENNINSIIWATGLNHDYSYIKLSVIDNEGKLKHKNGKTETPGLYFLGYPWMLSRKSAILFGIAEEAKFITDCIYKNAGAKEVK
jgi:putative flavoprotein involved in K+ transport